MSTSLEKKRLSNKRWTEANPEKQKEAIKRWKENNPDKIKEYALRGRKNKIETSRRYRQSEIGLASTRDKWYRRRYGITQEIYNILLESQEFVCKICGKPESTLNNRGEVKPLSVDHCHSTGKVRGLLCHHCNVLLGRSLDNIEILYSAIEYLKKAKE